MSHDPKRLKDFLQRYEDYVGSVLKPTQVEVMAVFDRWTAPNHWGKYARTNRISIPTPIRAAISRIKRPEQVVDKVFRKQDEFPGGLAPESFHAMRDTVGFRILVYFLMASAVLSL